MKMRALFFSSMLLFGAPAQADDALTLEQAQQIALQNHPQIISADLVTKAARQNVKVVRSAYFPQVTGDAVRAFADSGTRIAAPGGLNNPLIIDRGSAGVGASQLITDFGRTSDLLDSSKLQLEAQKDRASFTRGIVLLDVTRAYYNVLRAQSLLHVAGDTLKARKTLREQITSLRSAKMRSDLDVSIARQGVEDANLLMLKAQTGVDDAQATLSEALGYSEPKPITLSDNFKIVPPPADIHPLIQEAIDHNPELASLKAQQNAAQKLADAEGKAHYPTVSALGFAGSTPIRDASQPINPNYAAAGINVSIPLFTGGRLTAQEREAEYKAEAAEADLDARKNEVLRDIRIAFDNTQTSYQNIEVTEQFLKNAREALELTQARYELGKSSIVDLNQLQLAKTQAEIINATATYEYLIQLATLAYEIGGPIPASMEKKAE